MKRRNLLAKLKKKGVTKKVASSNKRKFGKNTTGAVLKSSSRSGEIKYIDTAENNLDITTDGEVYCVNLISEGSGPNNRIGRKIEMLSLQMQGRLGPIETNNQNLTQSGRILIVYDRQPNGAASPPNIVDIIKNQYYGSVDVTGKYNSFVNMDNRDRFQIIRDIRFSTPSVTRTGTTPNRSDEIIQGTSIHGNGTGDEFQFNQFIRLGGYITQYNSTAETPVIANISTGSLLVVGVGTAGPGAAGWSPQLTFRLRYRDT